VNLTPRVRELIGRAACGVLGAVAVWVGIGLIRLAWMALDDVGALRAAILFATGGVALCVTGAFLLFAAGTGVGVLEWIVTGHDASARGPKRRRRY